MRELVIGKNDAVFMQIGARYEGYASTIGRTVFFGEGNEELIGAVKASYEVKVGDRLEIAMGSRTVAVEVLQVADNVRKDDASAMYKEISTQG